ncbi:MAG: heavy-metal-associated domain-containing protein [Bacteroidia bacterium]|nr:heavy-metal-associated domain-containing protein [Bacteroidia bacterium]
MKAQRAIRICIAIAFMLICNYKSFSQFIFAEVGVDGLTCSQCSRSVEMSLMKLDFVINVKMDLESTVGKIIFKQGTEIDFNKIAKAIADAGFSIRFLKAVYSFNNEDGTVNVKLVNVNHPFYILKEDGKKLSDAKQLQFLGKEFMSNKEFGKWKKTIKEHFGDMKKDAYYITIEN